MLPLMVLITTRLHNCNALGTCLLLYIIYLVSHTTTLTSQVPISQHFFVLPRSIEKAEVVSIWHMKCDTC